MPQMNGIEFIKRASRVVPSAAFIIISGDDLEPLSDTSRQSGWVTYANGDGVRFDAIAHRDIGSATRGVVLDGDAYLPLTHAAALALGSVHTTGARKYYVGLRTR